MVKRLRRALLGLPIVGVIVLLLFTVTPFLATCGGHDEAVTEALLRCPRARELIGDDAHPARLGFACGSTETSGGNGTASWSMPFTGSRGRGSVSFDAQKRGGDWIERERGSPTAHVTVSCKAGAAESTGEATLYDGRGSFTLEVGDATRRDDDRSEFDDSKTTDQDGTPGCRVSGNASSGTLTLWDTNYEIVVPL